MVQGSRGQGQSYYRATMTPDRRSFFKRSAAVVSALMLGDEVKWNEAAALPAKRIPDVGLSEALDSDLLRAIAVAALPESLESADLEQAVRSFERWWAAFEPNAELVHPYGGWIIPYGPEDRGPEWSEQLMKLERIAQERFEVSFVRATVDQQRAILSEEISDQDASFPEPARAEHVAVALMAHYFRSVDANNRCYGLQIDKLTCRSIDTASQIPPTLSGRAP